MTRGTPDPLMHMPHWHLVQAVRAIDGDTIHVQAHLGLGVERVNEPVRLLGIQAAELHGPDRYVAQAARRHLSDLCELHPLYMHSPGPQRDRYGRWLAWLWLDDGDTLMSVNRAMVVSGLASEWWPQGWGHRGELPPLRVHRPGRLTAE